MQKSDARAFLFSLTNAYNVAVKLTPKRVDEKLACALQCERAESECVVHFGVGDMCVQACTYDKQRTVMCAASASSYEVDVESNRHVPSEMKQDKHLLIGDGAELVNEIETYALTF